MLSPSTLGDEGSIQEVVSVLESYEEMSVRPLSKNAWVRGGQEESSRRGLRRETMSEVEGLQEAVRRI